MTSSLHRTLAALALLAVTSTATAQPGAATDTLRLAGLHAPVEILQDTLGINHIYAANEHDLFFAQGYAAARDRMFQLEMWRRQATGTVAELLGPREVERDAGVRLFRFRGDMQGELAHYHPRGAAIVQAFVDGVNARVAEVRSGRAPRPVELELLGTMPGLWTPEVVVSRHQGLVGNATQELQYGRAVAAAGAQALLDVAGFGPGTPQVALDSALDVRVLAADVLAPYRAFRAPLRFQAADLAVGMRDADGAYARLAAAADSLELERRWRDRTEEGSNNWVVSAGRTRHGRPMMANDPHRALGVPALRSWVHLVAPGWNVIGGGEPAIPGVSIGHNEHGAWGLTVFNTDGEDLYVYRTDPADPARYWYQGRWEPMRVVWDTIAVKGAAPVVVAHRYTRHGPVVYADTALRAAVAMRAAWMEPGGAPYLASLRMDQARTWAEFREASRWFNLPGENMVWADTSGTIGWQAVGLAPVRRNWSGLVPVPGDGRYEWSGYLPMLEKPSAVNPAEGFIVTANNDVLPPGYQHRDAVGWQWSDPYRAQRIREVLAAGRDFTVQDMAQLQTDYTSLPARQLVPLLKAVRGADARSEAVRRTLLAWDQRLEPDSRGAALYAAWSRALVDSTERRVIPAAVREHVRGAPLSVVVGWLVTPSPKLGANPRLARDSMVVRALAQAVAELTERFGADTTAWRYGDERFKHVRIQHAMSGVVSDSLRARLDLGPLPRGGDGNTPGATGSSAGNQAHGATFRIAVDVGDWDTALGTQSPGMSGDPASPHYRDLFESWAKDGFFPVAYSRGAVERMVERRTVLVAP
ncbi:MAG TPA: penicillin acylase family protein [Gemmatimonadaceae bacterium]|nr:penicillin acylase family protein [Gemmatimonadaceae bacterium]